MYTPTTLTIIAISNKIARLITKYQLSTAVAYLSSTSTIDTISYTIRTAKILVQDILQKNQTRP